MLFSQSVSSASIRRCWDSNCASIFGSRLVDEIDFRFEGDHACLVPHVQQAAYGFSTILAVIQSALVDVHPDKLIGSWRVEIAGKLHRVSECLFAMVQCILDAVAQGV